MYQISSKISTFKQKKCIIPQMLNNLADCLWLTVSHKARISMLTGRATTTMLKWGRAATTLIHVAVDQSQIFAGCESESWIT